MFHIDRNKLFDSDLPLIVENLQVLHFDDMPILFSGTNLYGNRILASSVDEDTERGFARFFHVIIDSNTYNKFIRQNLSYRQILSSSKTIFVVDKNFDDEPIACYVISPDDIPTEYFPLEDSYCPYITMPRSMNFSLSLKGKLADLNSAIPKELSTIQNSFADMLVKVIESLRKLDLRPSVYITPYEAGSFKINYSIKVQKVDPNPDLFFHDQYVSKFINDYVGYCVTEFPDEVEQVFNDNFDRAPGFHYLQEQLNELYNKHYTPIEFENIIDILKKVLTNSANKFDDIADNIGDNISNVEINSVTGRNSASQIGVINTDYKEKITHAVEVIDEKSEDAYVDERPVKYQITIFHLNTDSRKGNAYIEQNDIVSRPKITISGDQPLEKTKYTESLHLSKKITIKGKAKRIGDKFKNIEIIFEE